MLLPLRPHIEAEIDLLDAALYYAERSQDVSKEILVLAFEHLKRRPGRWF